MWKKMRNDGDHTIYLEYEEKGLVELRPGQEIDYSVFKVAYTKGEDLVEERGEEITIPHTSLLHLENIDGTTKDVPIIPQEGK